VDHAGLFRRLHDLPGLLSDLPHWNWWKQNLPGRCGNRPHDLFADPLDPRGIGGRGPPDGDCHDLLWVAGAAGATSSASPLDFSDLAIRFRDGRRGILDALPDVRSRLVNSSAEKLCRKNSHREARTSGAIPPSRLFPKKEMNDASPSMAGKTATGGLAPLEVELGNHDGDTYSRDVQLRDGLSDMQGHDRRGGSQRDEFGAGLFLEHPVPDVDAFPHPGDTH
jgi:hypothetical protein